LKAAPDSDLLKPIGIGAIAVGRDALDSLRSVVAGRGDVAILTDAVPKRRAGADLLAEVERRLDGLSPARVVLPGREGRVHADEATLIEAAERCSGASCLVTVGSGTLADLGKAVSARLGGLPHVVVQTATSVNGFADDQSVLLIKGVKRTTPTRWPDALIADTDVLTGAPPDLNVAGVGDLLAMFTAPADWRLAHLLGMTDSYSPTVVSLTRRHGQAVLELAPRLARADAEAATEIAGVLALSGISMGVAGTTAPASGMEHTVSHLLEMAMNRRGRDSAYHGAQVGVTTVVAAVLWTRILDRLGRKRKPHLLFPSEAEMEGKVRAAFVSVDSSGEMGEECWRLYSKKLGRWAANRTRLEDFDWGTVEVNVGGLLGSPGALAASLAAAGAPTHFAELDPPVPEELVRWALLNCHLMRDRFTVADLAFLLDEWDKEDVDVVLRDSASLGGGL
jgi:glycerol-1-phosphate dehydrogenase [NAD(P)+]